MIFSCKKIHRPSDAKPCRATVERNTHARVSVPFTMSTVPASQEIPVELQAFDAARIHLIRSGK
jgi:hypothetical protein